MLASALLSVLSEWSHAFSRRRSHVRAVEQSVASVCAMGRRTITSAIGCMGRQQRDWSGEYRLHSQSPWRPSDLFDAVLRRALQLCPGPYVAVAFDDTTVRKTGKRIPTATWYRDPQSPPFRANLRWGLRYLHGCLLVPEHQSGGHAARALPICFAAAPAPRKPGRRATEETWEVYRAEARRHRLAHLFLREVQSLRTRLDDAGGRDKTMLVAVDATYCNGECLGRCPDRTVLIARSRRDAGLARPAPSGSGRVYDPGRFTPEQVRHDESIPWRLAAIHYGGKVRPVRYKEVSNILWPGGSQRRPLRLICVAPSPYRRTPNSRVRYHQPAYLLCTDSSVPAPVLLQAYFDRWQIEVTHREVKDILGVGQAQVWSTNSVARQPAMMVAAYSALHLAALETYGNARPDTAYPLPRWRANAPRPSILDLVRILRREMFETTPGGQRQGLHLNIQAALAAAAT